MAVGSQQRGQARRSKHADIPAEGAQPEQPGERLRLLAYAAPTALGQLGGSWLAGLAEAAGGDPITQLGSFQLSASKGIAALDVHVPRQLVAAVEQRTVSGLVMLASGSGSKAAAVQWPERPQLLTYRLVNTPPDLRCDAVREALSAHGCVVQSVKRPPASQGSPLPDGGKMVVKLQGGKAPPRELRLQPRSGPTISMRLDAASVALPPPEKLLPRKQPQPSQPRSGGWGNASDSQAAAKPAVLHRQQQPQAEAKGRQEATTEEEGRKEVAAEDGRKESAAQPEEAAAQPEVEATEEEGRKEAAGEAQEEKAGPTSATAQSTTAPQPTQVPALPQHPQWRHVTPPTQQPPAEPQPPPAKPQQPPAEPQQLLAEPQQVEAKTAGQGEQQATLPKQGSRDPRRPAQAPPPSQATATASPPSSQPGQPGEPGASSIDGDGFITPKKALRAALAVKRSPVVRSTRGDPSKHPRTAQPSPSSSPSGSPSSSPINSGPPQWQNNPFFTKLLRPRSSLRHRRSTDNASADPA